MWSAYKRFVEPYMRNNVRKLFEDHFMSIRPKKFISNLTAFNITVNFLYEVWKPQRVSLQLFKRASEGEACFFTWYLEIFLRIIWISRFKRVFELELEFKNSSLCWKLNYSHPKLYFRTRIQGRSYRSIL